MPSPITSSACRDQATENKQLAGRSESPRLRTAHTNLARTWTMLAGQLDRLVAIKRD
jgi:hypothetical protein